MSKRVEIIDCLGAPEGSGGMQVWAEQICKHWPSSENEKPFFVVPPWLRAELCKRQLRHLVWPNSNPLLRIVGQIFVVPLVFWSKGAKSLVSLNAVASFLVRRRAATVICHDWRHLKNPHEFGIFQRFYRKYWLISARRARRIITVSNKTSRETASLTNRNDIHIVEPGLDHLLTDSQIGPEIAFLKGTKFLMTYGQHINKRAELAIEALALHDSESHLVVLSCSGGYRKFLQGVTERNSLESRVHLLGRVSDANYSWLLQNCVAIMLLSSDEGYGIPVGEAIANGKRAIVTVDSGLQEIFGERAVYVQPDPSAIASILAGPASSSARTGYLREWSLVISEVQGYSRTM